MGLVFALGGDVVLGWQPALSHAVFTPARVRKAVCILSHRLLHAEGAELRAPAVKISMSRDTGADEMPPLLTASDWLQGQREFAQRAWSDYLALYSPLRPQVRSDPPGFILSASHLTTR